MHTANEQISSQLDENWRWANLSEVCQKVESVNRREKEPDECLIYIDIGSIDNNSNKIVGHKSYNWKEAPSRAQQIVRKGDVLFSTVRTYLKNIAIVEDKIYNGQIASSGFCVLRGNERIVLPKFIFYYSISLQFLSPLGKLQTGSSYPAVRDKDILAQPIPLPPIKIQEAIISKIEELFSELDKAIESLRTAQQQLKIYRQAVLKWAFEGKLTNENIKEGELPEGWIWRKLGDIAFVTKLAGFEFTKYVKYKEVGEIPVIRAQNVSKEGFIERNFIYVDKQLVEQLPRSRVYGGEILMVFVGAGLGNVGIVPYNKEYFLGPNVAKIKLNEKYCNKYIYYFLSSKLGFGNVNAKSKATAQGSVSMANIREVSVPLIPLNDQNRVVLEIESRLSAADKTEETISQNLQHAETLRQSILKKAFEGKLI